MHKPIRTLLACLAMLLCVPTVAADKYAALREKMVKEEIIREGITNRAVIQAMVRVPRHEFVPSKYHRQAYVDKAIAIGHKQTISPPFIVAYMTESLDVKPTDRVLEIGTGSGYQAAILGHILRRGQVHSIEIIKSLHDSAKKNSFDPQIR